MSILKKPYEITVWEDEYVTNSDGTTTLNEVCLGTIGSDKMDSQFRVIEPVLTRNVNGVKKLSFKMYKRYVDNITGEEVENPFVGWLVSERKVKLKYDGIWYDFIVKNITETSTNYLYNYSLEDALVQELSKNGFNVTFDAQLMNNIGDAKKLAEQTLADTDWEVESEAFVQTVEEGLVYLNFPTTLAAAGGSIPPIRRIKDQRDDDLNEGVDDSQILYFDNFKKFSNQTILAFYSCCKNKPHRFQFIHSNKSYDKNAEEHILYDEERIIREADCQYYIDFNNPDSAYEECTSGEGKNLGLILPKGFTLATPPGNPSNDSQDTYLSTWYRGKRYGYSQQSEYVPLLDKYCYNTTKKTPVTLVYNENKGKDNIFKNGSTLNNKSDSLSLSNKIYTLTKNTKWGGMYFSPVGGFVKSNNYIIKYKLKVVSGNLFNIGGQQIVFDAETKIIVNGGKAHTTTKDIYTFPDGPLTKDDVIEVEGRYVFTDKGIASLKGIFIQPNRGYAYSDKINNIEIGTLVCEISNLSIQLEHEYLYYIDSESISPTLVQNFITNYKLENSSGWIPSSSDTKTTSSTKPTVDAVYGKFNNGFKSMIEEFSSGNYSEDNSYLPYIKFVSKNNKSFLLNSGLRDNRTTIKNLSTGDQLVLDYTILDSNGNEINSTNNTYSFSFSLGEYQYNTSSGLYTALNNSTMAFSQMAQQNGRVIFTVTSSGYTEATFKKNSKLFLKITPNFNSEATFYIKKMALYRLVRNDSNVIIEPEDDTANGLNQTNSAVQNFIDNCVINNQYCYFKKWDISEENINRVVDKESLSLTVKNSLTFSEFSPVYNTGAKKVRSISEKESNYFNILQKIAETFEAWVVLEVTRNNDGSIATKKVCFKNYTGKDNHASIRYGVNLKDIQRTYTSNNIVTKLLVKANSNELAKDGFCTIQRAGANPTGENYIYDFQYYQNMGIMDTEDFLKTNYYITGAKGPDGELWGTQSGKVWTDGAVKKQDAYNLNGYFLRLKKINDELISVNNQISTIETNLLKKKADLETLNAKTEAAISSAEETKENFALLTGLYPEEAQGTDIQSVVLNATDGEPFRKAQEGWEVSSKMYDTTNKIFTDTVTFGTNVNNGKTAAINVQRSGLKKIYHSIYNGKTQVLDNTISLTKNTEYGGLSVQGNWEKGVKYTLTYELKVTGGKVKNIGCHHASFSDWKMTVRAIDEVIGTTYNSNNWRNFGSAKTKGARFLVTIEGKFNKDYRKTTDDDLWIQPNRGDTTSCTCEIFNVKLYKHNTIDTTQTINGKFYLDLTLTMKSGAIVNRTISNEFTLTGNETKTINTNITAVNLDNIEVKKLLNEYLLYLETKDTSETAAENLETEIESLKQQVSTLKQKKNQYLKYKTELNKKFFAKYNRFIQEGTWISEEYVDDNKYYADAQSVLYNSCYPQVSYAINILSLKGVPGYELFDYQLGDNTFVIDEKFFGNDHQEKVVITEIQDNLDDPTKNTLKVQNFKNQFQDLFQKITATVLQTQYSTGAYKKGAALVEANAEKQAEFLTNALNNASVILASKNNKVVQNDSGILITDNDNANKQLLINSAGILLGTPKDNSTSGQEWKMGLSADGICASALTTGTIDTGKIQIMNGTNPTFKWDAYGLSAYSAVWSNVSGIKTIGGVNSKKFVRFDQYGIYGCSDSSNIDGASWVPAGESDIDSVATFSLTWKGLKVGGENETTLRIGRSENTIVDIKNPEGKSVFRIRNSGLVEIAGNITMGGTLEDETGTSLSDALSNTLSNNTEQGQYFWQFDKNNGIDMSFTPTGGEKKDVLHIGNNGLTISGEINAETGTIGSWNVGTITSDQAWGLGTNPQQPYSGSLYTTLTDNTSGKQYLMFLRPAESVTGHCISIREKTENGKVTNVFSLSRDGTLTATKGIIGNWNVGTVPEKCFNGATKFTNALYSCTALINNSNTDVPIGATTLILRPSGSRNDWAIALVEKTTGGEPGEWFGLGHDGRFLARKGKIGSWTLDDDALLFLSGKPVKQEDMYDATQNPSGYTYGIGFSSDANDFESTTEDSFVVLAVGAMQKYESSELGKTDYIWKYANFRVKGNGKLYAKNPEFQDTDFIGPPTVDGVQYTASNVSDARLKNSIEDLSYKYEQFFDLLRPTRYKYNNGTSNRYHTGYIAQEVVASLEECGLTTQDFAAVVLQDPGTENELWQLRRDEFVSLNTWQIQKLKPRMTAAEEKIIQLEQEVRALREELAQLNR